MKPFAPVLRSCVVAACCALAVGPAAASDPVVSIVAGPHPTGHLRVDPETVRPERQRRPAIAAAPQLISLRTTTHVQGGFEPTSVPSLEGSPVEYLILTSSTIAPAFQRLADWKTSKGVPAVVRTLDDVAASGVHGSDLAETLRLYIRSAYLYWGVRFVLLGGDTEVIPPRYVTQEFLGLTDPVTDLYYSCLDGDWNANGNGAFGEAYVDPVQSGDNADLDSEVYVGRAPVSTLDEAQLFVDKTLEYESPTVLDHQDKFLLLAEALFPVDWSPGPPPSIDGATFAENLRINLIPGTTRVTRLYQTYDFYPGSEPLTVTSTISHIDAGNGIVVHIGHGWRYTLSVGDGSLDVGEAAAFANSARAGLMYMLNCTAAAFDFESFAETMLLNPHGGATLVVGAAREAFPLAAADYQYAFFRHLYVLGEHRVGEAMTRSRQEFVDSAFFNSVDRWTQLTYTLLGDPELPLRTKIPVTMTLGLPGSLQVGMQNVQVTVTDAGGPIAGALVCARKAAEEYRVARTDAAGHATLDIEPRTAGQVTFTVTAADRLPRTANVAVTVPIRALVVAGDGLVDDGGGSGSGNGDGRLDAGETVRLGLPLQNNGTGTVNGLTASLESSDADVTVVSAASAYPSLAPAATAQALTPFVIRVPPRVLDQRLITLTLRLSHNSIVETRRVEIQIHAARPRLTALRLDDARAGNNNQVIDANEEVDLYYTVENLGTGTLQAAGLELTALDAGMSVLASTVHWPAVLPGASRESLAPLTVRLADLGAAHFGTLALVHLQDPTGAPRRVDLRAPTAPSAPRFVAGDRADEVHLEWDAPVANDLLGYHVYRASAATGPFVRANVDLVSPTYFREFGLQTSTRYFYCVAAVDSGLVTSVVGPVSDVSTNPPQVTGWPNTANDRSSSSVGVADVNGDGVLDIVAAARQIYAWSGPGVELRDADQDPRTWGLFYGTSEAFGSITLADLDRAPGKEIIATTWDATVRQVVALHGNGTPMNGWPRPLVPGPDPYRGAAVAPVVANLDAQGAPEILLAARDGRLYGWHADGSEIADGDHNAATNGVLLDTGSPFLRSAPGVADLDASHPGAEIVFGGTNGVLYAIDAQGQALAGWPRTTFGSGTAFGGYFASGVSIADLDRDGRLEIIVLDGGGRLHAMHVDGSELPGFPVAGVRATSQSVVPSPAIGDLAGDAKLEIAIASSDGKLYVFDATGSPLLPGGFIDSKAATESSPILGDLDGDPDIEIVLGNEAGTLEAWNMDGTPVAGFPISLRAEVRGTPTLGDVDGDGDADLVLLTWDGTVRVWDLEVPWRPDRAPWPTYRGNVHRTGEYGYAVPTPVAVEDAAAESLPEGGVRLSWQANAVGQVAPEAIRWSILRAGPFQTRPLGTAADFAYTGEYLGERLGTGQLEFIDANAKPGTWYAYVLGMQEGAQATALVGPLVVESTARIFQLRILDNVPNPFNPETRIAFEVPFREGGSPADVEIVLFDAQGRVVRTLVRGPMDPGRHVVTWDGRDAQGRAAASGTYLARLASSGHATTRKLTLVR